LEIQKMTQRIPAAALACALAFLPAAHAAPPKPAAKPTLDPNVRRLEFTAENSTGANAVWTLTNYQVEKYRNASAVGLKAYQTSKHTEAPVSGSATAVFNGAEGYYTLTVEYADEPDGASRMTLAVDGKEVSAWTADGIFVEYTRRQVVPHVRLTAGAKITLAGTSNQTEYARLRALEIAPGAPPPPARALSVPTAKYSTELERLGDYAPYAERDEVFPARRESWLLDNRNPTKPVPYYFRAAKGEVFRAEVTAWSRATEEQAYPWSARAWPGEAPAFESGKLPMAPGDTAALQFVVPADGVYELNVGGGVREVSHGLTRRQGFSGSAAWHFFVPPGVEAVRVEAVALGKRRTGVAVKDGDGRIVWRGEIESGGKQEIAVPAEQAGKAWFIVYSTIEPTVRVEGVPPWCALTPAGLLVPRECLGKLARAASAAPAAEKDAAPARPLAATATAAKDRPRVTLTRGGQPASVIVVGPAPKPSVLQAADALRQHIQTISGAALPLAEKVPAQGAAVRLGVAEDFPEVRLPKEFGGLNPQGFLIRTEGNAVLLVGRTAEALPQAAYTFLRQLGCRWYFPGREWQVLPRAPEITVALDVMTEPAFLSRSISYGSTPGGGLSATFEAWRRANRMGGIRGNIHHSYAGFVPPALFKEHPEYFAMRDTGKGGLQRTDAQPCTTHPEVVKLFAQGAVAAFDKNPGLDLLPVSPNDGTGNMCRCDRCKAVGSYSDCALLIAHQAAEEVRRKYPGKWIGFYAYGKTSTPPTVNVPANPNLIVQVATAYNAVPVEEMLKGWPRYVGGIGVREYFAIPQWGANNPGGALTVSKARRLIPWYRESRALMINAESCAAWGSAGLGMYVAAQLMWDTKADVDALVAEFYADCFGAAAPLMKGYYERWEREKFNRRTLKLAMGDLKQALAAADSAGARKRVAMLAMYLHALKLYGDFAEAEDADDRVEAIEAGDTFLWRVKDLGLLHFAGHVWSVQRSGWPRFTLAEAAAIIEEDLKALAAVDAVDVETEFSWDLVPVPEATPGARAGKASTGVPYANALWLVSLAAQGTVTIEATGKDGKLGAQLLKPGGGAALDAKELALSDKPARLHLAAPEKGVYGVRVSAPNNSLYRIVEPARAVLSIPRDTRRSTHLTLPPTTEALYFHVPRDTKAFVLGARVQADRETRVTFANGKGETVLTFTTTGGEKTVHVPPGADGQVWRLTLRGAQAAFTSIYLLGVPPFVSPEAGALLTPRECLHERQE
jgi:hypothetical protein